MSSRREPNKLNPCLCVNLNRTFDPSNFAKATQFDRGARHDFIMDGYSIIFDKEESKFFTFWWDNQQSPCHIPFSEGMPRHTDTA
jgi:hypothetical protein